MLGSEVAMMARAVVGSDGLAKSMLGSEVIDSQVLISGGKRKK